VIDGFGTSTPARVELAVNWVNTPPTATVPTAPISVAEAGSVAITLTDWVTDVDSPSSGWLVSITEGSVHRGNLSVNDLIITYSAPDCYVGPDSFTYRVADGDGGVVEATVEIVVEAALVPLAFNATLETTRGRMLNGQLVATSCNPEDEIEFEVIDGPSHATLFSLDPETGLFTYTPVDNYYNIRPGSDSLDLDTFTFVAKGANGDSKPATVSIRVIWEARAPVADPQTVVTGQAVPVEITLTGYHVDNDPLMFEILSIPEGGTLSGLSGLPNLQYRPNLGFSGQDSFVFRVKTPDRWSEPSTVIVDVETSSYVMGDASGDGIADFVNYFPTWGNWYISQAFSIADPIQVGWGGPSLLPVPGDFTGNGTMNPAVFNPTTGEWLIDMGVYGTSNILWGSSLKNVIPVPMDYDGDGVTDVALYDRDTATWYIRGSKGSQIIQQWGWSLTVPAPGDYTGNGIANIAVFYPATGDLYIRSDSGKQMLVSFGVAGVGAIPVPADYDGDGTVDPAVFNPANSSWTYIRSSDGILVGPVQFGFDGVIPVPADYDGDGLADIAIYSPELQTWFASRSLSGGVQEVRFDPKPEPENAEIDFRTALPVSSPPALWHFSK
jgi:hypothetical protein